MTFKDKYKEELSDIRFAENFEEKTLKLLSESAERKENIIMTNKRKPFKIAALVVAAIMIFTCSAFAIVSLLNPSDVANHFGEKELAVLFEESDFEPVTVKGEVYSVTFMGTASGKEFYTYEEDGITINENRTYAVWAVYRNDGATLSVIDGSPINVIPVADGYRPDALFSLGMGGHGTDKDGVLYYLFDYTDLEVFADKKVSLMAFEGMFPTADILTANDNGEVVYAENYGGFKAVFELPLDESKADPEAAAELLSQF